MSKYIRTEDKIIDVSYWEKDDKGNYYTWENDDFCANRKYIYKTDIIKESDNLKELLDEYVFDTPEERDRMSWTYVCDNGTPRKQMMENIKCLEIKKLNIKYMVRYGLIKA